MKIVGICQIHNEIEKGNLERYLESVSKLCDDIIILDDSSTDNPDELVYKYTNNLYATKENNGLKKLQTLSKAFLLEKARGLDADWILALDTDEILEPRFTREVMEKEIKEAEAGGINSLGFIWTALWLSASWYRTDSGLNTVSPPRLYKNLPGDIKIIPEMHQALWPAYANNPTQLSYRMIHYSSVSLELLAKKIVFYIKTDGRIGDREKTKQYYLNVLNDVVICRCDEGWFDKKINVMTYKENQLDDLHEQVKNKIEELLNENID